MVVHMGNKENMYTYVCQAVDEGNSEIENLESEKKTGNENTETEKTNESENEEMESEQKTRDENKETEKTGETETGTTETEETQETDAENQETKQQPFQMVQEWAEKKPELLVGAAIAIVVLAAVLFAAVARKKKKVKDRKEKNNNSAKMPLQEGNISQPVAAKDNKGEFLALTEEIRTAPVEEMQEVQVPEETLALDKAQKTGENRIISTQKMETESVAPPIPIKRRSGLYVGKVHNIGRRDSQQDSFGMSRDGQGLDTGGNGILAIVADGMGGMENGGQISALVTMTMLEHFDRQSGGIPGEQRLLELLNRANEQVNRMIAGSGGKRGGSTVIAALIQGANLYWLTVGDSHLYLYRKEALLQMNQDHIYAVELDEKAARGEISQHAAAKDSQRKALTSYIGMGKISKMDRNIRPMRLKDGDRLLLMSDGVFGTLSDEEILAAMRLPVTESGEAIDQMIQEKNRRNQDNYTALILEYVQER